MITITSTEKERIEGQMKTALPYLNDQIDFVVSIEQNEKARTTMTFKKDDVIYQLPMFYVAPSTDDSAWKELAEQIKEEVLDGILVINF